MTVEQLETLVIPPNNKQLIRLESVRKGVLDDKHIRQLGRELQCGEGTIRRDLDKLCLPPEKFEELLGGRPFEQIKKELIQLEWQREKQAELERLRDKAKNATKTQSFHWTDTAERYYREPCKPPGASLLRRQGT